MSRSRAGNKSILLTVILATCCLGVLPAKGVAQADEAGNGSASSAESAPSAQSSGGESAAGLRWRSVTLGPGIVTVPMMTGTAGLDLFVDDNYLAGADLTIGASIDDCQTICDHLTTHLQFHWGYLWGGRHGQVVARAGLHYGRFSSKVGNEPKSNYAWQYDTFLGPMAGLEAMVTPFPVIGLGVKGHVAPAIRFRKKEWDTGADSAGQSTSPADTGLQAAAAVVLRFGMDLTPR